MWSDISKARRPIQEQKQVNVGFPTYHFTGRGFAAPVSFSFVRAKKGGGHGFHKISVLSMD